MKREKVKSGHFNIREYVKNREFLVLAVGGLAGGFVNGLLGAGGGIIFTFLLQSVMSASEKRDTFANVIAATLPISALSAVLYGIKGNINTEKFSIFLIPAIAGGFAGALLLNRINTDLLKKLFAVLVIWSGIYMLIR